jgi:triosephosphate isomerase
MQQKVLIIGNWKMNPQTEKEAITLAKAYKDLEYSKEIQLACAVPIPFIPAVKKVLGKSKIALGLQNFTADKSGAHTGEIAFSMVSHLKPEFALIGHSERRAMGETDEAVNQKILAALKNKITPVLCIGEKERDEHGFFLRTIEEQLKSNLAGVPRTAFARIIIAYEPIWAIGSHALRETTPEEVREMVIYIKKTLSDISGISTKDMPAIIYGGSVNELNGRLYLDAGADGLLPGHMSLEPKKMQKLIQSLNVVFSKK